MHGVRTQGRAYALQLLYMAEIHSVPDAGRDSHFWSRARPSKRAREFAEQLVQAVGRHQTRIDEELAAVMVGWKLHRVSLVVRTILRLAAAEMAPPIETPPSVAINEALELTRDFMDEDSARFVNSVLDEYRKNYLTVGDSNTAGSSS